MNIDIASHIGAMVRAVEDREFEGKPAKVVVASRAYDTDRNDLWDAVTNPERIPRWFLPVSGEFKPGGNYQLEGNAGGTIEKCEPPELLALTWVFGEATSWVRIMLSAQTDGSTLLKLEHIAHMDAIGKDFWDQYGPGATGVGWELGFMGLALHLASGGAPVDKGEVEAWSASEEGKQFVRLSSEGWRDASIASGTDEKAATEAANRTTGFYTGGHTH